MTPPLSPDHNSKHQQQEEDSWSEISTPSPCPSPSFSSSSSSSWILLSNIALEANDDNDDEEDDDSQQGDAEQPKSSSSSSSSDQKVKCSASSASSENLLSVLIRERVLGRLPAKQLLNLRTVSRQWNDFITSPFFIHSHSQSSVSISGVFYTDPFSPIDKPSFSPFGDDLHGVQSPELNFLPEPVAVLSSSRGLLCCKAFSGETTKYLIANPLTGSWVPLPPPANDHGHLPAAVIVFDEPFTFNFSLDYKVVVAYDLGGCYGFEVFRSREWEWSASTELCVTERIEPESGVAAGGCAHWRTSMQTVVSYDPEVDRSWDVVWPESYSEDVVWELAEIDRKLSCVCVKGDEVCVYGIENGSQGSGWKEVRKLRRRGWGSGEVRVVRVQEVREVVWVENGRVWRWSLEDGKWGDGEWYVGGGVRGLFHLWGVCFMLMDLGVDHHSDDG